MKKRIEVQNDNQFTNGNHTEGPSLPRKISKTKANAPLDQTPNDDTDFFSGIINARFPRLKATPSFLKKLKEKL